MRKDCSNCKHDDCLRKAICDDCYNTSDAPTKWEPADNYKPDTNADRIRAMSDGELACYFSLVENRKNGGTVFEDTSDEWLKWLKQPVEEE